MCFPLFKPLISSSSVYLFLEYKFCSFVKFVFSILFFHVIVSGIVFILFFSLFPFLLCKKKPFFNEKIFLNQFCWNIIDIQHSKVLKWLIIIARGTS